MIYWKVASAPLLQYASLLPYLFHSKYHPTRRVSYLQIAVLVIPLTSKSCKYDIVVMMESEVTS